MASNDTNTDESNEDINVLQHRFMTDMVDDMATALQAYGQSQGYQYAPSFYTKLTWSSPSLFNTVNFGTEFTSDEERAEIAAIGNAEETNQILVNNNGDIIEPQGIDASEQNDCN